MHILALVLMALAADCAPAQTPTYRITKTYPLGGDGTWDYIVPDPPNHRLFIARQNRVMVVDENTRQTARRGHRHQRRARNSDRRRLGPWLRHVRQRPVRYHVRPEDSSSAGPHPRRRGRRRDPV